MSVTVQSRRLNSGACSSEEGIRRNFQMLDDVLGSLGWPGPITGGSYQPPRATFSGIVGTRFRLLSVFSGSPLTATGQPTDETGADTTDAFITLYDYQGQGSLARVGDNGIAWLLPGADGVYRWELAAIVPSWPEFGWESRDSTGGVNIEATATEVVLDEVAEQIGSVFVASGNGVKTYLAGTLDITATVSCEHTQITVAPAAMPTVVRAYLAVDGVEIPGTRRYGAMNELGGKASIHIDTQYVATSGEVITLECLKELYDSGPPESLAATDTAVSSNLRIRVPFPQSVTISTTDTSLRLAYDFDKSSAADMDYCENTATHAPRKVSGVVAVASDHPSGAGNSGEFDFNTVNSWLYFAGDEFAAELSGDGDIVTFLFWIKPQATGTAPFVNRIASDDGEEWSLVGSSADKFVASIQLLDSGGLTVGGATLTYTTAFTVNNWYMVVMKGHLHDELGTWNLDLALSVNGGAYESSDDNPLGDQPSSDRNKGGHFLFNTTTVPPVVGSTTGLRDFRVGYFRIWDRALTAGEITSHYNAGSGLDYPFA